MPRGGGNSWNDFQHSHAGQGYSRSEMSAMYHASSVGSRASYSSASYTAPRSNFAYASASPSYASSSSASPWNAFQQANAGRGLTPAEMSCLYRSTFKVQAAPAPAPRHAVEERYYDTGATTWNTFQRMYAGQGLTSTELADMYRSSRQSTQPPPAPAPAPAYDQASFQATATRTTRSSSRTHAQGQTQTMPSSQLMRWNDFQHAHRGQGLSREEMSRMYRTTTTTVEQVRPSTVSSSVPVTTRRSHSEAPAIPTSSDGTKANAWHEFQRTHGGQGLSSTEMPTLYHDQQISHPTSYDKTEAKPTTHHSKPQTQTSETRASPASAVSASRETSSATKKPSVNPWNAFQRAYAGKGLSARQMSLLYQQFKTAQNSKAMDLRTSTTITPSMPVYQPNAFTDFQHQYQQDHPDEEFNAARVAKMYQKQELHIEAPQPRSNAETVAIVEHRMMLQRLMLEIARLQAEQQHDQYQWAQVARGLEAEEGNLNRRDFFEEHKDKETKAPSTSISKTQETEPQIPTTCELIDFGRLELEMKDDHRIGAGGCGVVYAGLLDHQIQVAVKVLDAVNTKAQHRFEQEMLAIVRASIHPNIVRVLGYTHTSDAHHYGIVMELMGGGDLAFVLHRNENVELDETKRLRILVEVIGAIEFIHSQGITHRDIKPHNVLLSADMDIVKLADFGLAGFKNSTLSTRQSSSTAQGVESAQAVGLTPAYAAPEVIKGKLRFRDTNGWKKSDVFSFAVLLSEVVMCEQPWEDETPQFILNAVSNESERPFDVEDLKLTNTEETKDLQALVASAWHQDPAKRPSAADVYKRLKDIAERNATITGAAEAEATTTERDDKTSVLDSPRSVDCIATKTRPKTPTS